MPARPKMLKSPRGKKGVDAMKSPAKEEPKVEAKKAPAAAKGSSGPRGAAYDQFTVSSDGISKRKPASQSKQA